jgi:hypothetical protein
MAGRQGGFVLDLVTGAESATGSLDILVKVAAAGMSQATGARISCGLVLSSTRNFARRTATTTGTGQETASLARLEQEMGEGPLTDALAGSGPIAMNQVDADVRWPKYRRHLKTAGFNSVLAVPLSLADGADAALAFFAVERGVFPLPVMADGLALADLASRSLKLVLELNSARGAALDLRSALESRTSIDIACGVIMAENRCSYRDAIDIISKASSHRNIKLRKVAEEILDKLPGGAPRTHFEH